MCRKEAGNQTVRVRLDVRAGLYGVVVTVSAVELRFCPGFW